jgi:P pilus assembly chaperone PapD
MKIRLASATVLAAAAIFATLPAANAAVNVHPTMHAFFHSNNQKKIKFTLRNDTGAPLELKIGDKVETLKSEQTLPLKLPVGTRVTANADAGRYHTGDVIVEVTENMYNDSTITLGK